jgi:hypothetical protein
MVGGHWGLETRHEVAYKKARASRKGMLTSGPSDTPIILTFNGDMSGGSELYAEARQIPRSQRPAVRLQHTQWQRRSVAE